jgi:hypothetical protein
MPDHVSRPETLGLSPGSGFIQGEGLNDVQDLYGAATAF